jgi:GAF domain-containing protein
MSARSLSAAETVLLSDAETMIFAAGSSSERSYLELRGAHVSSLLKHWFGVEFTVIEPRTADVLHLAADQPCTQWSGRDEICQAVARRRRAEFIEEVHPLLLLAVPLHVGPNAELVAVAAFISRPLAGEDDAQRVAAVLNCSPEAARHWAQSQTPVAPQTLQRLAELVIQNQEADQRIESLESEVEKLSMHVGSTYEEISLIYRLTQNLRISSKAADLGKLALEWLVDTMPFEGMAIQFLPRCDGKPAPGGAGSLLLSEGDCPLDNEAFTELVSQLNLHLTLRPVVINRPTTASRDWTFPEVRELILVPIGEGDHLFGFLGAFNRRGGGEFGTTEADMLASVAAILGIHSGNAELYQQQAELLEGIVRALTSAIDAKDPYTCGHSDRVARVARRLAEQMGCSPETAETIYLSGLLHDVGKIGIDDQVLRKPGKLTPAEFEHIKTHARIGHNILVDLKQLGEVLPVVLHHHESWDGSGYPDGLTGEQIPELARIVAVADAFDAMGSDRPYRQGMPDEKLDEVIRSGAGRQWDPRVVEAFFAARNDIRQIARSQVDGEQQEPWRYM